MGVATAPQPEGYAGAGDFPKGRFGLRYCEPSAIHGDGYPSNRVARCI
jgi:hypothetical protein